MKLDPYAEAGYLIGALILTSALFHGLRKVLERGTDAKRAAEVSCLLLVPVHAVIGGMSVGLARATIFYLVPHLLWYYLNARGLWKRALLPDLPARENAGPTQPGPFVDLIVTAKEEITSSGPRVVALGAAVLSTGLFWLHSGLGSRRDGWLLLPGVFTGVMGLFVVVKGWRESFDRADHTRQQNHSQQEADRTEQGGD